MTKLIRNPAEAILNPDTIKKSGVNVRNEMADAKRNIQAAPVSHVDFPARLILLKKP
ncbi:hypothetical protein ACFLU8_01665 [Chloroflexota bacterium]